MGSFITIDFGRWPIKAVFMEEVGRRKKVSFCRYGNADIGIVVAYS